MIATGVDIVEIDRVAGPPRTPRRPLPPARLHRPRVGRSRRAVESLAARFAAKEALIKALGLTRAGPARDRGRGPERASRRFGSGAGQPRSRGRWPSASCRSASRTGREHAVAVVVVVRDGRRAPGTARPRPEGPAGRRDRERGRRRAPGGLPRPSRQPSAPSRDARPVGAWGRDPCARATRCYSPGDPADQDHHPGGDRRRHQVDLAERERRRAGRHQLQRLHQRGGGDPERQVDRQAARPPAATMKNSEPWIRPINGGISSQGGRSASIGSNLKGGAVRGWRSRGRILVQSGSDVGRRVVGAARPRYLGIQSAPRGAGRRVDQAAGTLRAVDQKTRASVQAADYRSGWSRRYWHSC